VLGGLVSNIVPEVTNPQVKLIALKGVLNLLRFCIKNFKIDTERRLLLAHIIASCSFPHMEVRVKAMQCLVEISREFYDYLTEHIEDIGKVTFTAMRLDESDVALQALEVWSSLCDEEISKRENALEYKGFIKTAAPGLVNVLLENLSKKTESDDDDWNICVASGCCLNLVSQIVGDQITNTVIAYTSQNIISEDWKLRDGAIFAFGSILEGIPKDNVNTLVDLLFFYL
jgi:importin subunit beta-1